METYRITRDEDKDLQFTGKEIASVDSAPDMAQGRRYSNERTELSLYKTKAGAFVCWRVTLLKLDGERDIYEAAVCYSVDAVIGLFGTDWLAKELYDRAEIEAVEVVA